MTIADLMREFSESSKVKIGNRYWLSIDHAGWFNVYWLNCKNKVERVFHGPDESEACQYIKNKLS